MKKHLKKTPFHINNFNNNSITKKIPFPDLSKNAIFNYNNPDLNKAKIELLKVSNNINLLNKMLFLYSGDFVIFCYNNIIYPNFFSKPQNIKLSYIDEFADKLFFEKKNNEDNFNIKKKYGIINIKRDFSLDFSLKTINNNIISSNIFKIEIEVIYDFNTTINDKKNNMININLNYIWKNDYVRYFFKNFINKFLYNDFILENFENNKSKIFSLLEFILNILFTNEENKNILEIDKLIIIINNIKDEKSFEEYYKILEKKSKSNSSQNSRHIGNQPIAPAYNNLVFPKVVSSPQKPIIIQSSLNP